MKVVAFDGFKDHYESWTCCTMVDEPIGTIMRCPDCKEMTVTVGEDMEEDETVE